MSSGEEREDDEAAAAAKEHLQKQFRLCTISIAEGEAKRNDMEISKTIVACISNLAFKFAAHRNEHLAATLRSFRDDLKAKEPQTERKRKKRTRKQDRAAADDLSVLDA
ncbi:unnamed protein product [Cuscuta campestris]|uniref:Uncharacterized protein n=1 Tax=Cuscuta campestris TaxID=132261 RepID=A0A484KRA7_9ASTE|nr:unnamed protein product [Cuscuta campestris]